MVKTEINKIQSDPSKSMPSTTSATSKKKYKGVRMRSWGSWVSEIRAPNQKTRIWLGSYSTEEAAARAYDAALLCLKGSSANLNFPLTSSPFIPDTMMSPKSIQRVAAAAAANANYAINDNATNPTTTATNNNTSPPPSTSSSPSPSSSSSSSSSTTSSNQNDDIDACSLVPYWPSYTTAYDAHTEEEPMQPSIDPWIDLDDLQSPKYTDHMLNASAMFNIPSIEDFYEGGDISLWSFC